MFFQLLGEFEFLRNAVLGGVLASAVCGLMGPYVVSKKISYLTGGIAHTSLGGMGVFYHLGWPPVWGALLAAVFSAGVISYITQHHKQLEDSLISALWAVGMAIGILFIAKTPGYNVDLMSYLFGNILLLSSTDLLINSGLLVVILLTVIGLARYFLAISFDEEYARMRGVPVEGINAVLLCLVALTVVVLIQAVGLILVIALLAMPAQVARRLTHNLYVMMIYSGVIGAGLTFFGIWLSYHFNAPSGACIILLTAAVYGLSLVVPSSQKA